MIRRRMIPTGVGLAIGLMVGVLSGQTVSTVAGGGVGDGEPATRASLSLAVDLFIDRSGNIFVADLRNHRILKINADTGTISTVAGNGLLGFSGDGDLATNASLKRPTDVFVDNAGNIFIADWGNHRIRKVDATTGIISTVAGNGKRAYAGDGGPAINASLNSPTDIFVDNANNIFIADSGNHRIRKVDATTGIISTVAGNGKRAYAGDGGPATSALLAQPGAVSVDDAGNIFIADTWNNRIRKVDAETGIINTVAGSGERAYAGNDEPAISASLLLPADLFLDSADNIFILSYSSRRIRKVDADTGIITHVAGEGGIEYGGDGIHATNAGLSPSGLFVDNARNVFIADRTHIRRVAASNGVITTVAGNGELWYAGDGGPATSISLGSPEAVFVDNVGNMFIADSWNGRIYKIERGGTTVVSENEQAELPSTSYLEQNHPNPFNSSTAIRYQLSRTTWVRLDIFNLLGQKVKSLIRDLHNAGVYEVRWDGTNDRGMPVSSGVYLIRFAMDGFSSSRKMALLK